MKILKYSILAILIIYIIFSCNSQTTRVNRLQEVVLQSQVSLTKDQLSSSKEVIAKRLKSMYINDFTITQNDAKSQLIVNLSDSLKIDGFSNALTSKGEVGFCLAFGNQTITPVLKKLDPKMLLTDHANVEAMLSVIQFDARLRESFPVIGAVESKDTSLVREFLNMESVKNQLPKGTKFCWGNKTDTSGRYSLFAISEENLIPGKLIKEVSVSTNKFFEIEINLQFNAEGSEKWKELTGKNLGKSIAIVIDHQVYSAPVVRSEVNNGKCMITGNYTGQEANNLVAIVKNGELVSPFTIVK